MPGDVRLIVIPIGIAAILLVQLCLGLYRAYGDGKRKKRKPSFHLRGYTLIYSDCKDASGAASPLLTDEANGLLGKPDMIFANGRRLVPVELKSGRIGDADAPHTGDLMQLAVYFLLTEAEYGIRPTEGRLIYSDWMFVVKNSARLRKQLFETLDAMRTMLDTGQYDGDAEPGFAKCRRCFCRDTVCEPHKHASQ